jgi:small subunit ribosomal protein S13
MVYLFESELPENKSVIFAMTHIFGLGKSKSNLICKKLGFSGNLKIKNISKEQLSKLITTLELMNIPMGSELKKIKLINIKNLASIRSFKGLRLKQGLPVRGQRTHTNARTSRKRR